MIHNAPIPAAALQRMPPQALARRSRPRGAPRTLGALTDNLFGSTGPFGLTWTDAIVLGFLAFIGYRAYTGAGAAKARIGEYRTARRSVRRRRRRETLKRELAEMGEE